LGVFHKMNSWYIVLLPAVVFFLLVPGIGAFAVRHRWRRFRRSVAAASLLPTVTYGTLAELRAAGSYRFFGHLEAIEDNDVIWLNDGTISVAADVASKVAHILPARELHANVQRPYPEATPDRLPWSRLTSLPERTPVFVAGRLEVDGGRPVFRAEGRDGLLLILFEGAEHEMLQQSIWTGRQRNEYWNPLTPASLAVGSLSLLLLSYFLIRMPAARAPAIIAASAAFIPLLPFLPPGFVTFPLYRRMWRRGRYLRAERDLLRLAARHEFDESGHTVLPDGEPYERRRVSPQEAEALDERGARRISATVVNETSSYYAFGVPSEDGGELRAPEDPMTGLVVVPGPPEELAALSQRHAQFFEVAAVALLLAGIGVNFYLTLLLASRYIF
jgi:hypothetical protein